MGKKSEGQPCTGHAPLQDAEQFNVHSDHVLYDELSRINNELVNAQRELVQKNFELEALAAQNMRLYAEAQELLRMQQAFVSVLTHDLKTPVSSIVGFTQLLARRILHDSAIEPAKILSSLRRIETAAEKMTKQINDVLETARLQTGEVLPLSRESADLVSLVERVSTELQPKSMQPRVIVEATVPSLVGEWDVSRLERMLSNLLSNAIKYSPHGGDILVEVALEEATAVQPGQAVIRVQDNGVGIPVSDLPTIFEPFRRAQNTIGRFEGTGIGLFSIRHSVEQHGGTISVESEEGVGTTFTVYLPLA